MDNLTYETIGEAYISWQKNHPHVNDIHLAFKMGFYAAERNARVDSLELLNLYEHGKDKEFLVELNRMAGKGGSHG